MSKSQKQKPETAATPCDLSPGRESAEEMDQMLRQYDHDSSAFKALNTELTAVNRELRDKVVELQAVNNDLHNLLGSTVIATIFLDLSFRIRRFTPAAKALFNLTPADIGRPLTDTAIDNIGDGKLSEDMQTVLRNVAPIEKEIHDGRDHHYLCRVTPYRTNDNRIEGVVLTYTDISRMKRTEGQLRVRERQQATVAEIGWKALSGHPLQELLDNAVARVAEVSGVEYGKILELQPGNQLLLRAGIGWKDGLVGNTTVPAGLDSQSGYTLTTREPVIVEDMQQEQRFTPAKLLLDHGVRSGISVIIGPLERPYGVLGVHSRETKHFTPDDVNFLHSVAHVLWDAIERHRREEMLYLSEARLRLAMEFGRIGCWQWDIKHNIIYWDKSMFQMMGLPDAEGELNTIETFYQRVYPDDLPQLQEYITEVIRRRSDYESEFRITRADNGQVRWLGAKGGLLFNEQGEPFSMFGVHYDVTEEKSLKMELEAARQTAEAASQVKSEFLANMSHEIRSPLTAVLGYSDLILVETDRKKARDFAVKIKQNGQYLLEIVDDVLDLSRAEANKLILREERFSPQRLMADLCSVMRMRAREKGIDLSLCAEGEIPETIEGDPIRLRQILLNLIGNAVKFTSQGQIVVTMRLENPGNGEYMLAFEVHDTGIGIAPGDLERMFEPFEQAETSSSRRYQGAGLGLTISKHLSEMLGGTITVRSELGRGSVFTVRLPTGSLHDIRRVSLDPNLLITVHTTWPAETQYQLNARVLIVDDIEDVRVLLEQILCGAGASVKTAADAEQALQCVAQAEESGDAFDLILMDIMLPGMDGVEAVRRLRAGGFRRPIVALTAAARESDRQRCLQAGCNDYFCKPIEDEHLLAMVDNYTQGVKSLTQPAAGGEVQGGEPVKVLIVEDNHDAGTALCKLLEAAGYISNYAADAASALETAQHFMPHVVLLDLTLPDRDGTEVLRILKSKQEFHKTLFIALSGRMQPDEGDQLLAQGFDHFLLKPASLANLKALLPPVPAN
jgi:two-component system CheB/CheR fusion protein